MGKPVGIKKWFIFVHHLWFNLFITVYHLKPWLIFEQPGNLVQYGVKIYFQAVSHYEETFQKSCSIMVVITESAKR